MDVEKGEFLCLKEYYWLVHQYELLGTYILASLHLNKVDTAGMAGGIPYEAVIPCRFHTIYKLSRHPALEVIDYKAYTGVFRVYII